MPDDGFGTIGQTGDDPFGGGSFTSGPDGGSLPTITEGPGGFSGGSPGTIGQESAFSPNPAAYDACAFLPSSVTCLFPAQGSDTLTQYAVTKNIADLELPELGGVSGFTGTKVLLYGETATFASGGDPTPSNDSDLQALATQAATDWYRLQLGFVNRTYQGCIPWVPTSLDDAVIWRIESEELSNTYIRRPPWQEQHSEPIDNAVTSDEPGCGLQLDENGKLKIKPVDLVGDGLEVDPEDADPNPCKIDVKLGCGLQFDADKAVEVNNTDLAGPGLTTWGDCGLQATGITPVPGCGIDITTVDTTSTIKVKASDLAGSGLVPQGECGLAVGQGCGIKVNADDVAVYPPDLIQDVSLKAVGTCGLGVNWGCGLKLDITGDTPSNKLIVNNDDLIGNGLKKSGDCGIAFDNGCGLVYNFSTGAIDIDATQLASTTSGLIPNGTCGIKPKLGDCLILTGAGTGGDPKAIAVDLTPFSANNINIDYIADIAITQSGNCINFAITSASATFVRNACGLVVNIIKNPPVTINKCVCGVSP